MHHFNGPLKHFFNDSKCIAANEQVYFDNSVHLHFMPCHALQMPSYGERNAHRPVVNITVYYAVAVWKKLISRYPRTYVHNTVPSHLPADLWHICWDSFALFRP